MSLLREFFETNAGKAVAWKPPAEAPDAKYEREASQLAREAISDAFVDGSANGGSIAWRRTPTPAELKAADEAKATQAKTLEGHHAAEKAALEGATAERAKIAGLEAEVARRERAEAQLAADVAARLKRAKDFRKQEKRGKR
jgi:hypothetical protein